jgi:hypothetical protein
MSSARTRIRRAVIVLLVDEKAQVRACGRNTPEFIASPPESRLDEPHFQTPLIACARPVVTP